jgi:hypothetical protein
LPSVRVMLPRFACGLRLISCVRCLDLTCSRHVFSRGLRFFACCFLVAHRQFPGLVAVRVRVAVYCHSVWSFPHVTKERPKTLTPAFANCDAASSVVLVLIVIFVGASLDHIPPTVVRRFVAIASQCLTITQLSLRVIAEAAAKYATREANGLPGLWVLYSPPYAHPTQGLHLDAPTLLRHGLATGTSATLCISPAKVCSANRYFLTTLTSAGE